MDQKKIGKFIAQCRKEQNLTQVELANQLNVSDRSVSKWENGKCMPDLSLFKPLCDCLHISINELLSGERIEPESYQQKLEENIIINIHLLKKKIKEIFRGIFLVFVFLIIVLILFWGYQIYQRQEVKIPKENIIWDVCLIEGKENHNQYNLRVRMRAKDGISAHLAVPVIPEQHKSNFYLYRTKKETKHPNLLNDIGTGEVYVKRATEAIYYDGTLIWDHSMDLKICE